MPNEIETAGELEAAIERAWDARDTVTPASRDVAASVEAAL